MSPPHRRYTRPRLLSYMERYGRARAVYCFTPALGSLAGRAHQVQRLHRLSAPSPLPTRLAL